MNSDNITFAFDRGFGPWLTPLRGKIPLLGAWTELPPVEEPAVREWTCNAGFRTGAKSGYIVIDDDQHKNGIPEDMRWTPPPTDLIAITPTGGRHHYYIAPDPCPSNSVAKLAPYVDVRSNGGQVVFPGSEIDGVEYTWESTGDAAELPADVLEILLPRERKSTGVRVDMTAPVTQAKDAYVAKAMLKEVHRVRNAQEGERNNILNTAAYNLGQLVAGGELDEAEVAVQLLGAAQTCGLSESEASKTIHSGLAGGAASPRNVPEPRPVSTGGTLPGEKPEILVPGSHVMPGGEYIIQGWDTFNEQVLDALPAGALYRRSEKIGEIVHSEFRLLTADSLPPIIDRHVKLIAGVQPKREGADPVVVYRGCNTDHARKLIAYGESHGSIRDLETIATYPVYYGWSVTPAKPGWNPEANLYQTWDRAIEPLPVPTAKAVLDDLVCDFPFSSPIDKANYIGLLITPLLRAAIAEPVPLHLIGSPVERSGKTKLAETVLGRVILGKPTPPLQIGNTEDEREKRITSLLLMGYTIVHLDNLREFVDSTALASLLTSRIWQSRILGHSAIVTSQNNLILVASGNNIHATGEMAKRTVPITLLPNTATPEDRSDFKHPLLASYVDEQRERVLGALLGLIEHWRAQGAPLGSVSFGGFERWAAVVGGVMQSAGYGQWLTNLTEWRGSTDDYGDELRELVRLWFKSFGYCSTPTSALFQIAQAGGLFERQLSQGSEAGQKSAWGRKVVTPMVNRIVDGFRIEVEGRGNRRRATLVRVGSDPVPDEGE